MISLLPQRVMKLLEFIGFDGNRVSAEMQWHALCDGDSFFRIANLDGQSRLHLSRHLMLLSPSLLSLRLVFLLVLQNGKVKREVNSRSNFQRLKSIFLHPSQEAGLREVMWVYEDRAGMRQFIACFTLLGYHLLLSFFIGSTEINLPLCKKILDEKLEAYPDGAFFIFFKGRYHFVQGEMHEAIRWYKRSVESQDDWPQFHHICYWELYWACMFDRQWRVAAAYADKLLKESKWSRCMYGYLKAAALCMVQKDLTDEERREQMELMESVPKWKQRIAGKSLPMEKFAVRKAERFVKQRGRLTLPALELIYVWNGFRIIGQQYSLVEPFYAMVAEEEKRIMVDKGE